MAKLKLLGMKEVAALLDVTPQRANDIAKEPGFPKPADTLSVGRIWLREDVVAWAKKVGRRTVA